jgi:hypothetical protein
LLWFLQALRNTNILLGVLAVLGVAALTTCAVFCSLQLPAPRIALAGAFAALVAVIMTKLHDLRKKFLTEDYEHAFR